MELTREDKQAFNKYKKRCLEPLDKQHSYQEQDKILNDLFTKYKTNDEFEIVKLKVGLLNRFYSTAIINTDAVSKHIYKNHKKIDTEIQFGDFRAIEHIRKIKFKNADKAKDFYSFATKFCHFSNNQAFSIYDKYVGLMLTKYIQNGTLPWRSKEKATKKAIAKSLKNYKEFMSYIDDLMQLFGAKNRTEIDNFLWQYGQKLEENQQKTKQYK